MYANGFTMAFVAALRHQQLARLQPQHFHVSKGGARVELRLEGEKGPKNQLGVRPDEVHICRITPSGLSPNFFFQRIPMKIFYSLAGTPESQTP